jgi:hypothetical protein
MRKVNVLKTLRATRNLLTPKKNWCKKVYAKRSQRAVLALYGNDPEATCWCMEGAMQKVLNVPGVYSLMDQFEPFFPAYARNFPYYNDHATHEQVLYALDLAIANATAAEAR